MRETTLAYKTALKAARKAGSHLLARFRRGDRVVLSNATHDVKLDVDVETERLIIETIRRVFPGHGFLGEEGGLLAGSGDPPSGGGAPAGAGSGGDGPRRHSYTWVIDPLDGTVNFSKGIPHFCTSVAVKRDGTLIAGAVLDPVRGELFSGLRVEEAPRGPARRTPAGSSAWGSAYLNGARMGSTGVSALGDAVVAGGFFKTGSLDEGTDIFRRLSRKVLKVRFFGSAALDLCYLASGRVNAYVQYSVHEWDIAAALLVAELAGKRVEVEEDAGKGALNVLAADPGVFDELKEAVAGGAG